MTNLSRTAAPFLVTEPKITGDEQLAIDLKTVVANVLERDISPEAKHIFLTAPIVAATVDPIKEGREFTVQDSFLQRVDINKFFLDSLFMFRSYQPVDIQLVLPYLSLEGRVEDWISLFTNFVVPFLKEHDVLSYYNRLD